MTGFNVGPFPNGSSGYLFLIIFISIFILVIGTFLFVIIKSLMDWTSNNNAPIQDRHCLVVAKRMQLSSGSGHLSSVTSYSYYITFEFEDQSRLELSVERQPFGHILEGDRGNLTFQGTRFKDFVRRNAV
ncbi:hypothetical protein A8709_02095 [Paenibacillus pectinilyticus]|uniref:DUF2500 domain-containing protein n=1 Tax=Paenibacillus pectinilyticus TaxID=512399 RepID=A0A1C1A7F2_9BACL|nr:hypothetical protein A8709_02095 [Paenibacillus pectinilyticus]